MAELIPDESWVFEGLEQTLHCVECGAFFPPDEEAEDPDGNCIECGGDLIEVD